MDTQHKEYDSLIDVIDDLDKEGIVGFERQKAYKRYLNLRARMLGRPYSGSFELTPLCNFDCKMCYVHLTKAQMEKDSKLLTIEQWIDIMRQAVDAGMMHADLTGGECLTYPGFRDVYLYLVSRGIEVSVLTNAELITEDLADFFQVYPPAVIQTTIYGYDEDSYERVTGKRAFAKVTKSINLLKERGIKLFLTLTPNQYVNSDKDIVSLLNHIRSFGVRYGIGTGSLPARPKTERTRETYAPDVDVYVTLHKKDQEYIRSIAANVADNTNRIQHDYVPKGFRPQSKIQCSAGQCSFHVNWMGEITPCIPFHTITHSLLGTSFCEGWEWIKSRIAAYEPPHKCNTCSLKNVCVSCPAEKTLGILNGSLNEDVCQRFRQYVDAGIVQNSEVYSCE